MQVLKASQERLLAALLRVVGIVERRHTLPILANVLMRKRGTAIELTTSDLDLQISTSSDLGGEAADLAITVDARKLVDILRAMPPDQIVTLTQKAQRLTLQGGRSRFTLLTLPATDFPLVQRAADFSAPFAVPQTTLKALIEQVEFAMATHDIRYFLNGVLFVAEGHTLTLVATDGNRLAMARANVDQELPRVEVILPRKAVHELQQQLRDSNARDHAETGDASVNIHLAAAQARFEMNGIEFIARLIEGRFPDYKRVIPAGNEKVVTLGRAPFLAGLQRAALLTSDKFRGVRVRVDAGALRIASSNAAQEEATEDLDIDYAGDGIEIGFNVTYVVDVLSKTNADMVSMALQDAQSSALFTFPDRPDFKYVVSPMRL